MSVLSRKCCCGGDNACLDVWVWSTETCGGNTKLYAPQQTWDALIGFGITPWDIVWDYSVYPPTYSLLKNGSPTDTKTFNFNGAFVDAFNPNPPEPIGLLGCGELEFVGYLCDKQGTEKCDPDEVKGEECLCMREQERDCPSIPGSRFCEDCDTLSDFVAGLYIIGYGTRPAGFDDLGYAIATSCAGKRVWLGRGWYNNTSWDIEVSTIIQPYPKYINIADDCCDDQCIVEPTPSCADWLRQNPPLLEFVQGGLPTEWSSRSRNNSEPTGLQCDWSITYGAFSFTWNPGPGGVGTPRFEDLELQVTVRLEGYEDTRPGAGSQCDSVPFPQTPLTQSYLLCGGAAVEFCPPNTSVGGTLGSYTSCPGNPPAGTMAGSEFCCIDAFGICTSTVDVRPNVQISRGFPGGPTSWPPAYGTTALVPLQLSINANVPIRPNCDTATFPPIGCGIWESGMDDNQWGYLKITMPDAPPECDP